MEGLLLWSPCHHRHTLFSFPSSIPFTCSSILSTKHGLTPIKATLDSTTSTELTARERRQLRNEKRESKAGSNWREELEEKFIKKTKKKQTSWMDELNLDTLAVNGPQWWIVRVGRTRGQETAGLIARLLARNFPDLDFKVYAPALKEMRKLKNGTFSVKEKPIFPGCVFLWCLLNKDIHDFIIELDGVGGFIGSKVGNTKRQINKPRPVSDDDIQGIFQQAKEEQEKSDQAFEKEHPGQRAMDIIKLDSNESSKPVPDFNPKKGSRKKNTKLPTPGSTVRVVSGTFAEFEGSLKKLNRKAKKATVGFTLFGKESLVDLDLHEIVAET